MPCGMADPVTCVTQVVGTGIAGGASGLAGSAWEAICESFAKAASDLLHAFARMFVAIPPVDLGSPGIKTVYGISLGVAGVISALLLLGQVIRTAITHDGSALATGIIGIIKAVAAFALTVLIASTAITAADDLTGYIVTRSFGSSAALATRISNLIPLAAGTAGPAAPAGGVAVSGALLLLLSVIGILLTIVLWFEMLLRNAAIAVLVATSPIAASGLVSDTTKSWWPKLVSATVQLIILKPIVALVFALGFALTGQSQDIETLLAGMLVLLLAVLAWPVIARFFTFASIQVTGSAGLGMLLGFAAGRLGGGGAPVGIAPDQFSMAAEARTMGAAGGGAGLGAGAAAGGVPALVAAGVQAAHRAVGALSGHMEQMAAHAGIAPAYPGAHYGYSGGSPRMSGRAAAQAPPPQAEPPETRIPVDPDPGLPEEPAGDNLEDGS